MTNRDAWVCNFSRDAITRTLKDSIGFFNKQVDSYLLKERHTNEIKAEEIVDKNPSRFKWDSNQFRDIENGKKKKFSEEDIVSSLYRPFVKTHHYFNKELNWSRLLQPKIFPSSRIKNLAIVTIGPGSTKGLSVLISNCVPNRDTIEKCLCFPLHYYEERDKQSPTIFDASGDSEYIKRDGVSDFIFKQARENYGDRVTKEDIFYYVYGILHSLDYRTTFANDLKKMLPRIPLVDSSDDFWAFSKSGRDLAELHLNYESVAPYPDVNITGDDSENYTVEKMRYPKKDEQHTIIYNSYITISDIPDKAYEYVVNGKSAIAWIMERYQVKTDKKSGIKNDPNDWAKEVNNPRYILDLLLSIINVSVQTVDLVNGLPKLDFE